MAEELTKKAKEEVLKIIKEYNKSAAFTDRKTTDTPTDALSVVNKKFIDDLVLGDLSDTTITSVADNELLAYDSSSGDWINQTASEAGIVTKTKLDSLDDVAPMAEQQGDVLYYTNDTNWDRLAAGTSGFFLKTQGSGQNPIWASMSSTFKIGDAARNVNEASGTQNIAHGLGTTPTYVRITALAPSTNNIWWSAYSVYNGTTQISLSRHGSGTSTHVLSPGFELGTIEGGGNPYKQAGVITFDATNIIITWTRTGSAGNLAYGLLWEAQT